MADDFSIHNPLAPPPASGKVGDPKEERGGLQRRRPKGGKGKEPKEDKEEPGGKGPDPTGKVLDITI